MQSLPSTDFSSGAYSLTGDERIEIDLAPSQPGTTCWLAHALRPEKPEDFIREYPQVFTASSKARFVTAFIQSQPCAHATIWPTRLSLGEGQLDVALISHVYTEPKMRGQGCASRVLEAAHRWGRAQGAGLAALWSEGSGLYERLGYHAHGRERLLTLDRSLLARARLMAERTASARSLEKNYHVSSPQPSDWQGVAHLREQRECGVALSSDILSEIAEIPNCLMTVARRGHEIIAFAILGRGADFCGVIHEWGGDTLAAIDCCDALLEANESSTLAKTMPSKSSQSLLLAPASRAELPWVLRQAGAPYLEQPLARFKILSQTCLSAQLESCAPDLFTDPVLGPELAKMSGDPLLTRLFDEEIAPLPLFFWGLESI